MALDFSDVIDSLKHRVRNPFFGAFTISFLFINWHIPFGLILLDKADIVRMGYRNWIVFIDYHLSFLSGFLSPLIISIVAVLGMPFIITEYKKIKAQAQNRFDLNQKKHAKVRYIEMEKYLQIWQSYDEKLDQLEVAIKKAEVFKEQRESLMEQIRQNGEDIESWKRKKDEMDLELKESNKKINNLNNIIHASKIEQVPSWLDYKFNWFSFTGNLLGVITFEQNQFDINYKNGSRTKGYVDFLHHTITPENPNGIQLTCAVFPHSEGNSVPAMLAFWVFRKTEDEGEISMREYSSNKIEDFSLLREWG